MWWNGTNAADREAGTVDDVTVHPATDKRLMVPGTDAACWFELPFAVRSKSNYRQGAESDWAAQKQFTADVAGEARIARPGDWPVCDPDVRLDKRPQVVAFLWARTLIDAGNLSKSILDACESILYVNDAQCRHVGQLVERAGTNQRGICGFALLTPGASDLDVIDITAALARTTLAQFSPPSASSVL